MDGDNAIVSDDVKQCKIREIEQLLHELYKSDDDGGVRAQSVCDNRMELIKNDIEQLFSNVRSCEHDGSWRPSDKPYELDRDAHTMEYGVGDGLKKAHIKKARCTVSSFKSMDEPQEI